jgi:hypothetical protein
LADATKLKEAMDHAQPALSGTRHTLLSQALIQHFSLIAQRIVLCGNDMHWRKP